MVKYKKLDDKQMLKQIEMADTSYSEYNKLKMSQEERDKLMQEFLSKGGKVTKLKPGIAEGAGSLNRSKTLQWSQKDIIEQEKE
jgi:hypothetical protein